jgi:hypothetical protein
MKSYIYLFLCFFIFLLCVKKGYTANTWEFDSKFGINYIEAQKIGLFPDTYGDVKIFIIDSFKNCSNSTTPTHGDQVYYVLNQENIEIEKINRCVTADLESGINKIKNSSYKYNIVNLSLSTNYQNTGFSKKLAQLKKDKDNLYYVISAGNQNSEIPNNLCIELDSYCIAATNIMGEKSSFSNYGKTVDVSAP